MQLPTIALALATVVVWIDGSSAWWSKTVVTLAFVVTVTVDIIRSRRLSKASK